MRTAMDRYNNDPAYHRLVHNMIDLIRCGEFCPSELREAVILANTFVEETKTTVLIPCDRLTKEEYAVIKELVDKNAKTTA